MSGSVPDHLLREVKLHSTHAERDKYDNLATVYEILLALNQLERAYARSSISDDDYTYHCKKLIQHYKSALGLAPESVRSNVEQFASDYHLDCSAALKRVTIGVPATIEFGSASNEKKNEQKHIMGATQSFVTVMDIFHMNISVVDKMYADIADLASHLSQLDNLPPDHESKATVNKWLGILNKMKATDQLDEDQRRQAMHEFEKAYTALKQAFD